MTFPKPKQRFQALKGAIKAHADMVDSEVFQRGLDYALLEYAEKLANTTRPELAATGTFKLQGAKEFMDELKQLSEKPEILKPKFSDNLPSNQ